MRAKSPGNPNGKVENPISIFWTVRLRQPVPAWSQRFAEENHKRQNENEEYEDKKEGEGIWKDSNS